MSRVSIRKIEDLQWNVISDTAPEEVRGDGYCAHYAGDEIHPQLFEVRIAPHKTVKPHAHTLNEIIYVVSGEMHVGNTVLRPGSSISIQGGTIYSFTAGDQGVHFLNFRPGYDASHFTPEQAKARQHHHA